MMRSAFFKRSAALLCAVLLLFTLAVPAFAEGELPEDGAFFAVGYRQKFPKWATCFDIAFGLLFAVIFVSYVVKLVRRRRR